MKPALKFAIPSLALVMTSACGQPERPKTVSDFCLNDRAITVAPAAAAGQDDPGNRFDSDETVNQVLEHNAVFDRLCPVRTGS